MRPRALALAAAALLLAAAAGSQEAGPGTPSETPDVPSGPATIRGQVLRAATGDPVPKVSVVLYALDRSSGSPGLRQTTTDEEGRFAFEGLSDDGGLTYLVGARYRGVPYGGGRVRFEGGGRDERVEIRVAEVTRDPAPVALQEARLRVEWTGDALRVLETLRLRNEAAETFYVPEPAREDATPAARAELPAGASDFRVPFGVVPEGVERDGRALAFWGPVYPRSRAEDEAASLQEIRFSYALPAEEGRVRLDAAFPDGVDEVTLLVPEGGPEPEGAGVREEGTETVQGRSYRRFVLTPGGAGRIDVALALPDARIAPDALSVAEARLVLDLDTATVEVRETHTLEVEGDESVRAPAGAALLRIPLPEAARDVRLGAEASGLRLAPHPQGGVAVDGVAPPGESAVEIAYRLPVDGPLAEIARSFATPVPLLKVYIADTGRLVPKSDRLHRRRPVRTQERTYIHLEAFAVEAGERIALSVRELPPREGLPRAAVSALVLLAAGIVAWALAAPLRRESGEDEGRAAAAAQPEAETASVEHERSGVYAALRDLEDDRELGKVSDEDYARLREELRTRALALLREERSRASAARAEAPAAEEGAEEARPGEGGEGCPACGAALREGDRFCAQCGRALASTAEGRGARG